MITNRRDLRIVNANRCWKDVRMPGEIRLLCVLAAVNAFWIVDVYCLDGPVVEGLVAFLSISTR